MNRYLEDPPTLLMPVHIGTYTAHVGMTVIITSLLLDRDSHDWALLVAFGIMVIYLLLFRLTVPYALVRRNPERSLLVLLPAFDLYARALPRWWPRCASARRQRAGDRAARSRAMPEVPPAPVHDPDEDRLVDAVARFAETLVRDVMTPRPDIVAMPAQRDRGRPAAHHARDQVQPHARLRREPRRHRGRGHGARPGGARGRPQDPITPLVRVRPSWCPETKKIAELLKEFQAAAA